MAYLELWQRPLGRFGPLGPRRDRYGSFGVRGLGQEYAWYDPRRWAQAVAETVYSSPPATGASPLPRREALPGTVPRIRTPDRLLNGPWYGSCAVVAGNYYSTLKRARDQDDYAAYERAAQLAQTLRACEAKYGGEGTGWWVGQSTQPASTGFAFPTTTPRAGDVVGPAPVNPVVAAAQAAQAEAIARVRAAQEELRLRQAGGPPLPSAPPLSIASPGAGLPPVETKWAWIILGGVGVLGLVYLVAARK